MPDPLSLGATAIEGASAVAGAVSSGLFGANQARKNRAFQERMYNKQLEDNRENWRMVNEYNLPSAALQRLIDAGLNPLLYYTGGSGGSSGLTSNIAAPQTHGAPGNASMPAVNPFQNLGKNIAQLQNLEKQGRLLESENTRTIAEGHKAVAEAHKAEAEAKAVQAKGYRDYYEGEGLRSDFEYKTRSLEDRLRYNELQNDFQEALTNTEKFKIDLIKSEYEKNKAAVEDLHNQMSNRDRITEAQVSKMKTEAEQLVKRTAHEIALMDVQARKATAEALKIEYENVLRSMPEWQAAELAKLIGEAYVAINEGDAIRIENVMKQYIWDTMPKYTDSSYDYRKWLKNYVEPTTQAIGNLLGGSGAAAIGLLK